MDLLLLLDMLILYRFFDGEYFILSVYSVV